LQEGYSREELDERTAIWLTLQEWTHVASRLAVSGWPTDKSSIYGTLVGQFPVPVPKPKREVRKPAPGDVIHWPSKPNEKYVVAADGERLIALFDFECGAYGWKTGQILPEYRLPTDTDAIIVQ
jgi:hypothetical protein